jgi:hypothetical protein
MRHLACMPACGPPDYAMSFLAAPDVHQLVPDGDLQKIEGLLFDQHSIEEDDPLLGLPRRDQRRLARVRARLDERKLPPIEIVSAELPRRSLERI